MHNPTTNLGIPTEESLIHENLKTKREFSVSEQKENQHTFRVDRITYLILFLADATLISFTGVSTLGMVIFVAAIGRWYDKNKSGWLALIPIVGQILPLF
jgi:uncharacterized ion transporter superfamily protein YfcC